MSDSAQYYTGRALGRHRLAPAISPAKTVEGAIGGVIFGAAAMTFGGLVVFRGVNLWLLVGTSIAVVVLGMLPSFADLKQEIRPMATLAMPVVVAEIGWVAMGLVDTLMVGPLGPEAIGAAGVGSALFIGVVIFAMGLLLGLDTLVSQAFGAGRIDECHRWLVHGIVLSFGVAIPVSLILFVLSNLLARWGLDPTVLALARPYLDVVLWSVLPLLLYATFRRYLQGMGVVRPVMAWKKRPYALVSAVSADWKSVTVLLVKNGVNVDPYALT